MVFQDKSELVVDDEYPRDTKLSADERHLARAGEHSKPVMEAFFAWAEKTERDALPKTPLGIALRYALGQRLWLERVLLDGRLELSNNRAERSIKPFVIGRKNRLFSNTPKGAKSGAVIYSVVETAKENHIAPFSYLTFVFRNAPNLDMNSPDSIDRLLPWNFYPLAAC